MSAPSLIALPLELQEQIIRDLGFPDNVSLRMACRHFYAIIKPLTHEQLLLAESTDFAIQKRVYACRDCLRLRPLSKFADNMTRGKRRRFGPENCKRFCVECGLKSGPGGNRRYTPGSRIMIQHVCHVICIRCGEFGEGALDDTTGRPECMTCCTRRRAFDQGLRRREERFQRARRRAERIAERARRRDLYGSDFDDDLDSEEVSPSLTWSEEQMEMVQAEADLYMNSPGPGSD